MSDPLLSVEGLTTVFRVRGREFAALNDVSLTCQAGERLGVVGESGSGKSVLALSLLNIIRAPGRITAGRILFDGQDVLGLPRRELRRVRGGGMSLIFQDAAASLTPVYPVGIQLGEVIRTHLSVTKAEATRHSVRLLGQVGIPEPERRLRAFPNELSGGMKQRVAIALALASEPTLLIADDPTSAVDVTIQAQILELLRHLVDERKLALIYISHDFRVVSTICERLLILYAGGIVEQGDAKSVFTAPRHPYTDALLACSPSVEEYRFPFATLPGNPPNPRDEPITGCQFHPRCPRAQDACSRESPPDESFSPEHHYRCWSPLGTRESASSPVMPVR